MKKLSCHVNTYVFLALLRAGLWEKVNISLNSIKNTICFKGVDWEELYKRAEEQAVVGLIAAGLDTLPSVERPPKEVSLQFAGCTLQIEQQNISMNLFVTKLIEKLKGKHIYALLVKGQGIALCYERPLWRACGDVDLLLDAENYQRAKDYLLRYAESAEHENIQKHLGMVFDGWNVELHGTLRSGSLKRMDAVVDQVQAESFNDERVRLWRNGDTDVFLPDPNNDIIFIFTHIIKHFFHEGIGLRQICDWCRLLWTYRDSIDKTLLDTRIRQMRLMSEWKVFASFVVNYLGMPEEALPLYDSSVRWRRRARKLLSFIMMTGNFGHNRDMSYYQNQPPIKQKSISFLRHTSDAIKRFAIFPKDTIVVWSRMFIGGIKALVLKGC